MGTVVDRDKSGRRGAGKRKIRRIGVEGAMTIYEAKADKQALLDALEQAAELEVDLSRVTDMDTAGVQVLLLAKREAARQGKSLRLGAHSPAAMDVFNCYQLVGYFGDPVVISSHER